MALVSTVILQHLVVDLRHSFLFLFDYTYKAGEAESPSTALCGYLI